MKFKADEIASVIRKEIEDFSGAVETAEVGRVLEVGDGIARCHGLSGAMAGEMVEFASGVTGLVFNLEEHSVGIIILGDYLSVQEGETVKTTGELLSVPVGEALLGRVVDPLGNPRDGGGPIITQDRRPLETAAPGVVDRQPVTEPMQTGIKADRRHDADRSRSARTDYRRPENRQVGDRAGHDHQSEGQRA